MLFWGPWSFLSILGLVKFPWLFHNAAKRNSYRVFMWVIQVNLFTIKSPSKSYRYIVPLHWRHNGHDSVSNHQPHDCLLNRLFRRRSKKISKLRVTGLCAGNSPETGDIPAQMASDAENVSIWWRHHGTMKILPGYQHRLSNILLTLSSHTQLCVKKRC